MSMLYKINNDYYIRVGRKYIKVDIVVKNNNVTLKPNNKYVIEDNKSLKVSEVAFDDSFKKSMIERENKMLKKDNDDEIITRNRYR